MLTNLNFIQPGEQWPPVDADVTALSTLYARNLTLFEAQHERTLKLRNILLRTNNLDGDKKLEITIVLDWFRRLSRLWADLIWGEAPRLRVGEPMGQAQKFLDKLILENDLYGEGAQVTIDQSRFGTGLWKVWADAKRVRIQAQTPTVWYVVVEPDNVKEVTAHVLAWRYDVVVNNQKQGYLRVEVHTVGHVERVLHSMNGDKIGPRVESDSPLLETATIAGVDFLVEPVHNSITSERAWGYDDYSGIESLIQAMEALLSQVASIIQVHADPKLSVPQSAASVDPITGERRVGVGGSRAILTGEEGENKPEYLVWDAQLTAAFLQFNALLEQLYTLSETSPAVFGQLKAGLAESGSALRRLLAATLVKVNRLRNRMDIALKRVLKTASMLALDKGVPGAVLLEDIRIDWQDGLPQDLTEAITQETTAHTGGLSSLESCLRRLWKLEGEELEAELALIEEEEAAKAPPMLGAAGFGSGGDNNGGSTGSAA